MQNWLIGKTLRLGKIEGRRRGWAGWMASPRWWTWVWASFGSWWWTGKSGVLKSMGSQRVRQDWATELKWMHSNRKRDKVYAFSLDNIQIIKSWSTLVDLMTNLIIFNFPLFYFAGVLCNKKELTTNYIIPSMSLNLRKLVASPDLWFHSNFTELYQQIHFDTFEIQL